MKKVIWLLIVLIVIAAGIIGFFWYQTYSAKGVQLSLSTPSDVRVGVPFEIKTTVSNDSQAILEEINLSITLPEGLVFMGTNAGKTIARKDIGSLGEGSVTNESFTVLAIEGEESVKKVEAVLSYVPGSLGAALEQRVDRNIVITELGVQIDFETPQKVFRAEEFEMTVKYKNNSDVAFDAFQIRLFYPKGFEYISSDLDPSVSNNVFDIGDLQPGSENQFKIRGTLDGADGGFFDLKTLSSALFLGQRYDLGEKSARVSLAPSPLELSIKVNSKGDDYVAEPGSTMIYEITYKNNTSIGLKDVIIEARPVGEMFDFSRVKVTGGSINSISNIVRWNASGVRALAALPPGETGTVRFEIDLLEEFPVSRLSDRDFTLDVDAEIESRSVPEGVAADKTVGRSILTTKVKGDINFEMVAKFKDAESGILNSGPFPAKINQPTDFTIHWTLSSYSTDIEDVKIAAFLGPNVEYTGEYWSSTGVAPTYNDRTQEIEWGVDSVPATTGIISNPVELIFQIRITPSVTDASGNAMLVGEANLSAKDLFTDTVIRKQAFRVNTSVAN
ncbi:MAG: hypothetical protein COU09_00475 [Candidatus Harrisonbacteria bacterium CG10_big_fil_rev_8_21_14_0_10_44_23]|uniref:DUF11 domain-containing protein n=1 Tax=Candidatus Harrisonbacteria bacterium CG10_big_fil_rev_8_21_14_0_10_44_23 TaxID=1974585 RepID=A0A2H0UQT9_9BACT|nr:MAG: hypothetical protein COU09_00475 [Candidatus Harrisonbacteria bacterium CG10_big_fil_rev_8_21_14_0_10_44_23]